MALHRTVMVTAPAQPADAPGENLPAPGAYDLTDIPTVLDELGMKQYPPDGGAFLQRTLTEISLDIARYCKRVFPVEGLTELIASDQGPPFRAPGDVVPIPLSRWPLANLVTLPAAAETDAGSVLTFASTAGVLASMPVAHRAVLAGTTVTEVGATTVTLSQPLATADPALATKVLAGDVVGFGLAAARYLGLTAPPAAPVAFFGLVLPPGTMLQSLGPMVDFAIDADHGRLIPLSPFTGAAGNWGSLPLAVAYSAGYMPIPADLVGAVLRWITWRWHARGQNPAIREQEQPGALGRITYWVGGPPNSAGIPAEILDTLDRYRMPSV